MDKTATGKNEKMKCLLNILSCSNIDMDEVLDNIESMGNKKLLAQHAYAITENKDGRFSTYVPDGTKPNHRRKIVKPSRELLEKEIIKFYRGREAENSRGEICLRNFYEEWLAYKSLHTNSSAYLKTIDELWKRYYANDTIADVPFVKLDKYRLDRWAHTLVKERSLTKKQYYNMAVIIRQSLDLADRKSVV